MQDIITEKNTGEKAEEILSLSFILKDVKEVNGPYKYSFKCSLYLTCTARESYIFITA